MVQLFVSWLVMLFVGVGALYVTGTFIFMTANPAEWPLAGRAVIAVTALIYACYLTVMAVQRAE